jgi:hypothetical protein
VTDASDREDDDVLGPLADLIGKEFIEFLVKMRRPLSECGEEALDIGKLTIPRGRYKLARVAWVSCAD